MRRAVLLGNADTKRTLFLKQAAEQEGLSVLFLGWKDWAEHLPDGELFLKIDPPLWRSCRLEELGQLTEAYRKELASISSVAKEKPLTFLNPPSVITELLNKRECKERLIRAGLPVTEFLDGNCGSRASDAVIRKNKDISGRVRIQNTEHLLEIMKENRVCQVFIKPVWGSGAAGVSAFRLHPGKGKMSLYTCALFKPEQGLINTKRLRCSADAEEIRQFLDRLLSLDCVVERWYAKAVYGNCAYDLRVVFQEGRVDYLLARLSKGPITNLQLNNLPLASAELGLSLKVREQIEELCQKAAAEFPGLESAGIDILLEKKNLKPRIIEMNAQGDLIYQDIYHENSIYRRQAARIKKWLSEPDG